MLSCGPWVLAAILVWAAACIGCDLAWRRLPNILTLGAIVAGVAVAATGQCGQSLALTLGYVLLMLVATYPVFHLGFLGGGDVKLFMAVAALDGHALPATVVLAFAGHLALAVGLRAVRGERPLIALNRSPGARPEDSADRDKDPLGHALPFGPTILVAWLLASWIW